jgi:hypothetical protein
MLFQIIRIIIISIIENFAFNYLNSLYLLVVGFTFILAVMCSEQSCQAKKGRIRNSEWIRERGPLAREKWCVKKTFCHGREERIGRQCSMFILVMVV